MPASPIRKLVPLADEARRRGVHVCHLNIGQPDIETPAVMRERLAQMHDEVLAYTPSGGTPEYLDSLQEYYRGLGFSSAWTSSWPRPAAARRSSSRCSPARRRATTCWWSSRSTRTTPPSRRWPACTWCRSPRGAEDGFHLPAREAWERALTPRTRASSSATPTTPPAPSTPAELEMVAAFCREHGLFLITDEVYREFVYDGAGAISALSLAGCEDLVVVVDSLSKRYSACGIRLGCLATRNRDVHAGLPAHGPGPALAARPGPDRGRRDRARARLHARRGHRVPGRRDVLFEGLLEIPGVFLRKPEGAFYFVARLPVADAEDFARWLLTDF